MSNENKLPLKTHPYGKNVHIGKTCPRYSRRKLRAGDAGVVPVVRILQIGAVVVVCLNDRLNDSVYA